MSSSAALNTFRNGDTSIENFTSLQQTLIRLLADKDKVELYNFEYGNTAAPGITAGSIVSVNYILYPFDDTELAQYLASDETVHAASEAPNGDYVIIAKPFIDGDDAFCSIYLFPFTEGNVEYRADYGGYYISGTQWRVLGGARNTAGSWTKKWRYQLNGSSGERTTIARSAPTMRMYSDGADILFRKIRAYNPNIIATPISNYVPTEAVAETGIIPGLITVQYPCVVNVWIKYAATPLFKLFPDGSGESYTKAPIGGRDVLSIGLLRQHTDGAWMTFGAPVIMRGLNSTYNNKSVQIPVSSPGKYKLYIESGWDTIVSGGYSSASTITTYACGIEQISASVSSVFGSTVDY